MATCTIQRGGVCVKVMEVHLCVCLCVCVYKGDGGTFVCVRHVFFSFFLPNCVCQYVTVLLCEWAYVAWKGP